MNLRKDHFQKKNNYQPKGEGERGELILFLFLLSYVKMFRGPIILLSKGLN